MLRNFPCSICPREFTTASSLGGHMRDHQRKGHLKVRPPAASSSSSSSSSSSGSHGKGKAVADALPFTLRGNKRKAYTNFTALDAAISLMMISRNMQGGQGEDEDEELEDEDYDEKKDAAAVAKGRRCRHACSQCGMVFPSYQALGGHRAGHTKVGGGDRTVNAGSKQIISGKKRA